MQLFQTLAHLFHPRRSNNHRPALLHPHSLVILAALALLFTAAVLPLMRYVRQNGNVLGYASNITASDVVAQTNQERVKAGVPELITNAKLNQAAMAKAQFMFEKQFWAHVSPDGVQPWIFFRQAGYDYRVAGENLARDFSNTNDMMGAWMASPTHRTNIVNGKYQEIGVAVVDGTLMGTETTLVVQLFGAPQTHAGEVTTQKKVAQNTVPATVQKPVATPVASVSPTPVASPEVSVTNDTIGFTQPESTDSSILGSTFFTLSTLKAPPLFSPLQLSKLFFLAIIFMVVLTLVYDAAIMGHRNTVRLVGKNFAHILLLLFVAYLMIFFKAGVVG